MKLLVCGGRDFADRDLVGLTLTSAMIHGGCGLIICGYDPDDPRYQGADQLAYEWAQEQDFPCRVFPADWNRYGRSAGPRRNSQMAADEPDECAAFPRADGSWGAGTLDMIGKAARAGAKVHRITSHIPDADTSEASQVPGRPTDSNLQNLQSAPNQPTPKEHEE
jgi:hypothetical protein